MIDNEEPIIYDYYYSAKQESVCIRNAPMYEPPSVYVHKTFNGEPFTTKVIHGKVNQCCFDDMILVGTGDESQVQYK